MFAYIGSAIDQNEESPEQQFVELANIIDSLDYNVVVFNPLKSYHFASKADSQKTYETIKQINDTAIDNADFALFVWNGASTYGVPLEIERCKNRHIPFVIWNKSPLAPGIYLKRGATNICNSKEEVISKLKYLVLNLT